MYFCRAFLKRVAFFELRGSRIVAIATDCKSVLEWVWWFEFIFPYLFPVFECVHSSLPYSLPIKFCSTQKPSLSEHRYVPSFFTVGVISLPTIITSIAKTEEARLRILLFWTAITHLFSTIKWYPNSSVALLFETIAAIGIDNRYVLLKYNTTQIGRASCRERV